MAKYTKLDMYDYRILYAGYNLASIELNDLTAGDVVSITGELVANDNLVYVDSHRVKVKDFRTGESKQFFGRNTMELAVEKIY